MSKKGFFPVEPTTDKWIAHKKRQERNEKIIGALIALAFIAFISLGKLLF